MAGGDGAELYSYYWRYEYEIDLKELPEWMIPYIQVVPLLSTEEGNTVDNVDDFDDSLLNMSNVYTDYVIQRVESETPLNGSPEVFYRLKGIVWIEPSWTSDYEDFEDNIPPIYINLNIYIKNPRKYYEVQTRKE